MRAVNCVVGSLMVLCARTTHVLGLISPSQTGGARGLGGRSGLRGKVGIAGGEGGLSIVSIDLDTVGGQGRSVNNGIP